MSKKNYETRTVAAIQDGTVIDHLDPSKTLDVLKILNLSDEMVAIGNYLESSKLGKKGVIKVGGKQLTKEQVNRIALLSPKANASVINNYQVVEKIVLELPEKFVGVLRCANPACVTRNDPVTTTFYVREDQGLVKLKCHHCERTFDKNQVELI